MARDPPVAATGGCVDRAVRVMNLTGLSEMGKPIWSYYPTVRGLLVDPLAAVEYVNLTGLSRER